MVLPDNYYACIAHTRQVHLEGALVVHEYEFALFGLTTREIEGHSPTKLPAE